MVDPKKAFTYFKNNFFLKKTSQNWYAFDNPFDLDGMGKRKMAVHFGYMHVKCWRTGWSGSILDFVMEYESISYYEAKMLIHSQRSAIVDAELIEQLTII